MSCSLRPATVADVPLILDLIRGLADYEKLAHEVVATARSWCSSGSWLTASNARARPRASPIRR